MSGGGSGYIHHKDIKLAQVSMAIVFGEFSSCE
jgi:hypothetical protein